MRLLFGLCLSIGVLLLCGCQQSDTTNAPALPSLTGHYRVIASFTDDASRAESLTNAYKSAPGLEARKIAWFVVGPKTIVSNLSQSAIPSRARLEKVHTVHGFQTVLIGENGGLIASQLGGLDIQALLDAINPLPSRQQALSQ